ncbi:MAG TPA: YetF domain-containing protein [Pirellulales bacterium]|nr:YetF domain-containing protein [Pirellulales bacterium]
MNLFAQAGSSDWLQRIGGALEQVFGGDTPQQPLLLYQIAARAIVVYLIGLIIVRIGKSRVVARITAIDIINAFILGSLLSRGITGSASISGTTVATVAIVACHWLLTLLACRWHWFGTLLKGRYIRPLVVDGKPQPENLRHSHISDHDLMESIRLRGVEDLEQVAHAYKERNGEISVITKKPRVVDVPVRDGVQTVRIELH